MNNFLKSERVDALDKDDKSTNLILTFDDGGLSFLNIAKILSKRNLIGHFLLLHK
tara:strand:+ start:252 stop:416 length:165 start_codon:yes stop_codon:yes gene_type:complete